MADAEIRRHYADTPLGQLHYAECGSGAPVLLLHQTPRSHDEFRELLPLLGRTHRAIAMDMLGFGGSARLAAPQHVEDYAAGAVALLDTLGIERFAVLGHHTGAYVAIELAASLPERVEAMILTSPGWSDAERAAHADNDPPVDVAVPREDGGHLIELWNARAPYYPPPVAELLDRYIRDALAPDLDPAEGHRACARYRLDQRIGLVRTRVLAIAAEQDPFSIRHFDRVCDALTNADVRRHRISTGTVALHEVCADEIAGVVTDFLA